MAVRPIALLITLDYSAWLQQKDEKNLKASSGIGSSISNLIIELSFMLLRSRAPIMQPVDGVVNTCTVVEAK
jgi:hypothetical protein